MKEENNGASSEVAPLRKKKKSSGRSSSSNARHSRDSQHSDSDRLLQHASNPEVNRDAFATEVCILSVVVDWAGL